MNFLAFDVESVAIDGAVDYIEPATAPKNYKDKQAIAEYVALANAAELAKAALDVDLGRIVALGMDSGDGPDVFFCQTEEDERKTIALFWERVHECRADMGKLVGFNCIHFDLPLLLRRSLYLGLTPPRLPINKYRHDGIEDLLLWLTFDGALRYRSLQFYKRRFALNVPDDPHTGADIAALVADGNWKAVASHCRSDLITTVAIARRIGVL